MTVFIKIWRAFPYLISGGIGAWIAVHAARVVAKDYASYLVIAGIAIGLLNGIAVSIINKDDGLDMRRLSTRARCDLVRLLQMRREYLNKRLLLAAMFPLSLIAGGIMALINKEARWTVITVGSSFVFLLMLPCLIVTFYKANDDLRRAKLLLEAQDADDLASEASRNKLRAEPQPPTPNENGCLI